MGEIATLPGRLPEPDWLGTRVAELWRAIARPPVEASAEEEGIAAIGRWDQARVAAGSGTAEVTTLSSTTTGAEYDREEAECDALRARLLSEMTPTNRALYRRIVHRRDAVGALDIDIVGTIRELREHG